MARLSLRRSLAAPAAATALAATLLLGLLVPIYTDEIAWRFQLSRSPIDGGFDRGLGDQCGPNTMLAAPWFMQPMRHLTAAISLAFADPRWVRVSGVALAFGWVAMLWTAAGRAARGAAAGPARAIALSLLTLGVLPFLLVWSRPEQPVLLAAGAVVLIALDAGKGRAAAWLAPIAIVLIEAVALGYHPKAVVFAPIGLVAIALCRRGWRIAAMALLIALVAIAFHYWTVRLACPGDPLLAAAIARENIAPALAERGGIGAKMGMLLLGAVPLNYVWATLPATDYISSWLPPALQPPPLLLAWQVAIQWAWELALFVIVFCLVIGAAGAARTRRVPPALALGTVVLATVCVWGASQLKRNPYESAICLPLLALVLVLVLPFAPMVARRAIAVAGGIFALLAITSALLLGATYARPLARLAQRPGPIVGQPYSYVPWGYPAARREMLAAARLCAIDPARARHLLVDDLSYFPAMASWRPYHRMALVGIWHGSITDPVAYLRARGSSGALLACAYLPPKLRARAHAVGAYCCLGPLDGSGR